jgi:phage terminase large subunit
MTQFKFLNSYSPIFYQDKTYWVISGGRASGKSTNIAAYFLMHLMGKEYFRGVIARYTQKSISSSIYRDILDLSESWNIAQHLEIKGDEIKNKLNNNMILTHAMKLAEGTITAKGKGLARVTHLLIDEATELPSEEEYLKLIDSFRQKGSERRIFLLFNPTTKSHWIFKRFYLPDGQPNPKWAKNHGFLHTTYTDNKENLDPTKVQEWEDLEFQEPEYFAHHIMGQWRDIGEGQVFKHWQFEFDPDQQAEVLYGLDFGFSTDPTAMVRVHKRGNKLWVEEMLYEVGLTNEDIYNALVRLKIPSVAAIYADAADPKAIETIRRMGYRNIRAAAKGPDSVRAGIDKLRTFQVFCNPNSENMIQEYYNYAYRPGTGQPIDADNHLMDAFRYALSFDKVQGQSRYAVMGRRRTTAEEFEEQIPSFDI